jgi:hypothetical protein
VFSGYPALPAPSPYLQPQFVVVGIPAGSDALEGSVLPRVDLHISQAQEVRRFIYGGGKKTITAVINATSTT